MAATLLAAMPGSIRLFVTAPLAAGAEIAATAAQAHYLGTVMRRAVGDAVVLFNGSDGEWTARIALLRRGRRRLRRGPRMLRPQARGARSVAGLRAAQARRDRPGGAEGDRTGRLPRCWPVLTARTNAQRVNLTRLHAIAIEAAEQSERLTVPAIHEPRPLAALLQCWPDRPPPVRRGRAHRPRRRSSQRRTRGAAGRPGRRLHAGGA